MQLRHKVNRGGSKLYQVGAGEREASGRSSWKVGWCDFFSWCQHGGKTRHKKQGEDDASLLVEQLLGPINERLAKELVSMRWRGSTRTKVRRLKRLEVCSSSRLVKGEQAGWPQRRGSSGIDQGPAWR